ncbi:Transmembrane domain-containing protein [Spironucleus salmonicida]|uniref:Transmembrane domain-containing protein n=1 Tax=Spironucleus salmonicida TaxID=348837 RepID=A0A9P8LYL6_9EUKA|nr:Transmembrane domain-containing protein [Spironucleus salmonicida]
MHDPTHPYRYQMQQVSSSADVASLQQNSSQRVVVTIQHSSIPMLRSQAAYRVRLQNTIFDRLCIMRVLKIECIQYSAQPVLALLVRIPFLVYCVPGLISEYILLRVVVYSINTIVIYYISLQAPLPMHLYYQTPFKILLYILQYCILINHYAVPLMPALVLSMELLGVPVLVVPTSVAGRYYTQNIQTVFGIACACTLQVRIPFLVLLCTWAHK